jgi:hypothetical protein
MTPHTVRRGLVRRYQYIVLAQGITLITRTYVQLLGRTISRAITGLPALAMASRIVLTSFWDSWSAGDMAEGKTRL